MTAESESGVMMFINNGPGFRGFESYGKKYSLFHEVRTDIVGWLPSESLYAPKSLFGKWSQEKFGSRERLTSAMHSALHAILRAAALELQIDARELGGIVYPDQRGGGIYGFVIFDESPGGSGAVIDLCLSGTEDIDRKRAEIIERILRRAVRLCKECSICNQQRPFGSLGADEMPISLQDYRNLERSNAELEKYRIHQSCYNCLRSYQNQRHHHLLDRGDAALLIAALLDHGQDATVEASAKDPNRYQPLPDGHLPGANEMVIAEHPLFPGGRAVGKWFYSKRTDAEKPHRIRLRQQNDVAFEMSDEEFKQLEIIGVAQNTPA